MANLLRESLSLAEPTREIPSNKHKHNDLLIIAFVYYRVQGCLYWHHDRRQQRELQRAKMGLYKAFSIGDIDWIKADSGSLQEHALEYQI
jgi:hypothetical protein